QIKNELNNFIGNIKQVPPRFSAININGKRAYNLAREGQSFEIKTKEVFIEEFELVEQKDLKTFSFNIKCGSGTYIRSLVRDLAYKLKSVAYMKKLIRTKSGPFELQNSVNLDTISKDKILKNLIPMDILLQEFKSINFEDKYFKKLSNGVQIEYETNELRDNQIFRIYCSDIFIGLGIYKKGIVKIYKYLRSE
ncbi:MAG: tRNA pseudouridine(55) synthase TruB, partial [Candidatus Woesearchaeota archaeon]